MTTSHTLNARRKQSGITLIEVSIGLIIAAIVAAAAFIAFQNNARRTEVQDNIKQITEVISETKQKVGINGGAAGYTGLTADLAATLGILQSNDQLNSYGQPIGLAADGTDAVNLAVLSWDGVEGDQCTDIVLAIGTAATNIANGSVGTWDLETNGPMSLANAGTVCGTDPDVVAD
ncbi:MAG: prepilin-type N-terminal cleavage/methylation domain-containing protein, partial [Limnobacter sp.]